MHTAIWAMSSNFSQMTLLLDKLISRYGSLRTLELCTAKEYHALLDTISLCGGTNSTSFTLSEAVTGTDMGEMTFTSQYDWCYGCYNSCEELIQTGN